MEKRYKIWLAFFMLLLVGLVYLETNQPQPVNWSPSYAHFDKIPLGSHVFYESLRNEYPEKIKRTPQPPFLFLKDSSAQGTYFFLNQQLGFGEAELHKLLAWTAKGNTVFLSAKTIGGLLLDTLNLKTKTAISYKTVQKQVLLNFTNPHLRRDSAYHYRHDTDFQYFSEIDTTAQSVLGIADIFEGGPIVQDSLVNFIKAPFGKGTIYLHLFPEAFGNYFMLLQHNRQYAEKAMAYLDFSRPVYWDGYYKIGKAVQTSPLYILLGNKYLKWAYYFVLIGACLFVLFEGKRKQKSIEIRPPLQNKTYEFTQAISGIYLEEKQHSAIAGKQIDLFLEHIRTKFRLDTEKFDGEFIKTLAERSGNPEESTRELVDYITKIQKKPQLRKAELLQLNEMITNFKHII